MGISGLADLRRVGVNNGHLEKDDDGLSLDEVGNEIVDGDDGVLGRRGRVGRVNRHTKG